MAKHDGSAARARRGEQAKAPREEGITLKSVDGDASMPIALDRVLTAALRNEIDYRHPTVRILQQSDAVTLQDLRDVDPTIARLTVGVPTIHRSKGLARLMIQEFRNLAERKGLDGVIAPVRTYEAPVDRRLEDVGFDRVSSVTLLMKETLIRVAEPALVPASVR